MAFWSRYLILIVACILLPLGVAFYVDTRSEVGRAEQTGAVAAKVASPALLAELKLQGHDIVGRALGAAQQLSDEGLLSELVKPAKRAEAVAAIARLLDSEVAGKLAFAWAIDDTGAIVVRSGQTAADDKPEMITSHPLFVATQDGYALDGFLHQGGQLFIVGAAPMFKQGKAHGALFVGRPVDQGVVKNLAARINTDITIVVAGKIVVSTLPAGVPEAIVPATGDSIEPVLAGRLPNAIEAGVLPMTPLFVDRNADGIAYTSVASQAPGTAGVRWVISVPSAVGLSGLARRQEIIFGVTMTALMFAILIGLILQRTFVSPIEGLVESFSDITQGKGDLREIPEFKYSGPLRRLVKLINMTLQKAPGTSSIRSYLEDEGSLPRAPAYPGSIVEPALPSAPLSAAALSSSSLRSPFPASSSAASPMGMNLGMGMSLGAATPSLTPAGDLGAGRSSGGLQIPRAANGGVEAEAAAFAASLAGSHSASSSGGLAATMLSGQTPARSAADIRGVPSNSLVDSPQAAPPASINEIRGVSADSLRASAAGMPGFSAAPSSAGGMPGPGTPMAVPPPIMSMPPASGFPIPSAIPVTGVPRAAPNSSFAIPQAATAPLDAPPKMGGSAAFGSGLGTAGIENEDDDGNQPSGMRSEATVVAKAPEELLARSARDMTAGGYRLDGEEPASQQTADRTVIAAAPKELLAKSATVEDLGGNGLDAADHAHFKETYERFIEMRRSCGEPTADLAFDRFVAKLKKNRDGLIKKYNCRTVRFQVYQKDGKAALKATPVKTGEAI